MHWAPWLNFMNHTRACSMCLSCVSHVCVGGFMYLSEIKDVARRMARLLPGEVQTTDLRRNALTHGPTGKVLWAYHTAWLMSRPTWYGQ